MALQVERRATFCFKRSSLAFARSEAANCCDFLRTGWAIECRHCSISWESATIDVSLPLSFSGLLSKADPIHTTFIVLLPCWIPLRCSDDYLGQPSDSGMRIGQRWRRGDWLQYSLSPRGENFEQLAVTCRGGDTGRAHEILAKSEWLAIGTVAKIPKPFRVSRNDMPSGPRFFAARRMVV